MMDIDLNHLTESERDAIMAVLKRDDSLRYREQERIRKLKMEIKQIRHKGVIKQGQDADKTCARCRQSFGWLFNKGALCPKCQHKICEKCREFLTEQRWLCILCFKQHELEAMSNRWFSSKFRKSKRHKKTNLPVTGPEIVRSSIRHSQYSRHSSGEGRSVTDEIKRALSNNNASPKSQRSTSASIEEESSDTQSMESSRSAAKKHADIHDVGFPMEAEKQMLMDLIRPKPKPEQEERPQVEIKRVTSHRYGSDSESSDTDSGPSSPQLSARTTESGLMYSDSVRSSIRSSSAMSSDGHISMVTESNISDIETMSLMSVQESPTIERSKTKNSSKSPDSVIENPSFSSQISRSSENGDLPQGGAAFQKQKSTSKEHPNSLSSDSEEFTTEQITRVRFRRIPTDKRQPRSPSPQYQSHDGRPESPGDVLISEEVPVHGSPIERHGDQSDVVDHGASSDTMATSSDTAQSEATTAEVSPRDQTPPHAQTSSVSSVPSISLTQPESGGSQNPSDRSSIGDDENIDEAFASHQSTLSRTSQKSYGSHSNVSNLLSPFSESRESIISYYSNAGEGNYGNIPVTGEIQFGLEYNYKSGMLEVKIKQCRDVAPVDTKRKRSDPYVKTYLLPDKTKSGKRKTRVKKHTLTPQFDEVLKYQITKSELETRTLWVTLWHNDTFGRNDFLGEVTIPLDYYSFDDPSPRWYKLQERNSSPMTLLTYKGDLILSLKYVTSDTLGKNRKGSRKPSHRGELHVLIKEARNLTAIRANGTSDPFCKGYLLPEKTKSSKQKTPVIKRDCNPQWNHTFVYEDLNIDDLRERSLELTVWDHDRFTSNDFLGGIRLNTGTGKCAGKEVEWMDAKGEEISLWQAMLDRPNCWIDGSLMLRPNMDKRK